MAARFRLHLSCSIFALMKKISTTRKHELAVYITIWTAVLVIPILLQAIESAKQAAEFDWQQVLGEWKGFVPFLVLFCVHDLFLAPLLMKRGKRKFYVMAMVVVFFIFSIGPCLHGDGKGKHHVQKPPMEMREPAQGETPPPPRPERDEKPDDGHMRPERHHRGHRGDPINPAGLINLALAITMCGFGVAVKLFFKSGSDRERQKEIEKQSLLHELEYLRYQINPHFFMNTLNNIHALIDIDPERAKRAIIELSVLMRYVLYGGKETKVPLEHELEFVKHYVALMRLRFTDKVDVQLHFPENVSGIEVPPLLYATFIENAFKHGISYRKQSFVRVNVELTDGHVRFLCVNSLRPPKEDAVANTTVQPDGRCVKRKGIGLENARKRLSLIYKENFTLNINKKSDTFEVELIIPSKND